MSSSDFDQRGSDDGEFSSGDRANSSSDMRSIFIGEEERFFRNVRLRRG